ncbi:NAD-binding protein [Virgisporangium aurantiacum]|uniref:NAD-binding protein n=1 Tax=Virgisporangium aurantiacum TaxID=175570 RepID=UPI00194E65A1|nr:NAD-binding protein [Virgisporangium aurantiacum]
MTGDLGVTAEWSGHVIVCGLEDVGLRTVEQLIQAGVRVAVVDDGVDRRRLRTVDSWRVPRITGDSRLPEVLAAAGLPGAAAVVCVQGDDLHAFETALLVRELRPELRVVARIRNPAVERALATISVAVLDVAGLSAPSIVEGCLRTGSQDVVLGGERFVAVTTVADTDATLRDRYGVLAPLAVAPAGGGEVEICPGRDLPVRAGDRVTLIGTPDELAEYGVAPRVAAAGTARPGWWRRLRAVVGSVISVADRRIAVTIGALLALSALSTTVLNVAYHEPDGGRMSTVDALYFTVETIVTVGYGDFNFRDQPTWLRLFAILLMILGAVLATSFFALLTNLLVTRRIAEAMGQRRVTGLSGHVVVIGLGSVGVRVVELLIAAGRDVVVVERDESCRYLAQVRRAGVPVVIADSTLPQTLGAVNLAGAAAVAVLTSDDLTNIETGLTVRDQLGPRWTEVPVVLRIFDRQLARSVRRNFGFGNVQSTSALAAPWFVGAVLGLDIEGTFYAGRRAMLVGRLEVAPGGRLDGLAMSEISARTRVVAISRAGRDGAVEHAPRRDTRLHAGDRAYLIGPYEELLTVLGTRAS